MREKKILQELFDEVIKAPKICRVRLIAGIERGGSLLVTCRNTLKTDPLQAQFAHSPHNMHMHAEIGAIKKGIVALKGYRPLRECRLFVCRAKQMSDTDTRFTWGLARPCPGCYSAIIQFGLKGLVYTLDDLGQFEILER